MRLSHSQPIETLITPHHTHLTELRLNMHDPEYTFSAPEVLNPLHPSLRVLHLSVGMMAEACLEAICALPSLCDLRLHLGEYCFNGWAAWQQLSQLSALKAFDLQLIDSWDDVKVAVPSLTQLTSLRLRGFDIPHMDACLLASLMHLQVLDIAAGYGVPGPGLSSLRQLPKLRELVVHYRHATEQWLVPPPPSLRRLVLMVGDSDLAAGTELHMVEGEHGLKPEVCDLVKQQQQALGPFCNVETRVLGAY